MDRYLYLSKSLLFYYTCSWIYELKYARLINNNLLKKQNFDFEICFI